MRSAISTLALLGLLGCSSSEIHFVPTSIPTGRRPMSVAVADFDRDGKLDLAVTSYVESNVGVYRGRGDGTFDDRVIYGAGLGCDAVVKGDFDGDGWTDLAVINELAQTVGFLRNRGDGTFSTAVNREIFASEILAGDFNGDQRDEIAVSTGSSSLILGLGAGTTTAIEGPLWLGARDWDGAQEGTAVSADFDRDGVWDLAARDDQGVALAYRAGAPDTRAIRTIPTTLDSVDTLTAGDFNLDGAPDLAVLGSRLSGVVFEHFVVVYLNDGTGGLSLHDSYASDGVLRMATGDLNGDGIPDLAITNTTELEILTGVGDGSFGHNRFLPSPFPPYFIWPSSMAIADLNGDGKADIVLTNPSFDTLTIFLVSS
jgi:hypothetical protein